MNDRISEAPFPLPDVILVPQFAVSYVLLLICCLNNFMSSILNVRFCCCVFWSRGLHAASCAISGNARGSLFLAVTHFPSPVLLSSFLLKISSCIADLEGRPSSEQECLRWCFTSRQRPNFRIHFGSNSAFFMMLDYKWVDTWLENVCLFPVLLLTPVCQNSLFFDPAVHFISF